MKKNKLILNKYLWWPLESVANWIGSFINQLPVKKKKSHNPNTQNQIWSKKVREIKKPISASPDAKGSPHTDTKIFNHPRR